RRLGITLLAIIFVLSLFAGRLVQLQGMESGTYRKLASKERDWTIVLPAERGSITGANGQVLAMTVTTYTVTADPTLIPAAKRQQPAAHHRPGAAVRGRAGVRQPGQEDEGGQLHRRDHPAEDRGRAGHGAVPDVQPVGRHQRGPDHQPGRAGSVPAGLHGQGD